MVFVVGVAFLVDWLLIQVFSQTVDKAALITAIVFLILGLLYEIPNGNWPWKKTQ